jgi:peptide/nickel transport system substrate-binding protein
VPSRLSRSPAHQLTRSPSFRRARVGYAALCCVLVASACSSGGSKAQPTPSASSASPTPSPTSAPKPGGTLRIAGVTRVLQLDPASPQNELTPPPGQSEVSAAQGNQLIGRLVVRQLYGYPTVDPTQQTGSSSASPTPSPSPLDKSIANNGTTASGPVPDLAAGQPKISDGGRKATITLRTVRWDVPSGRRVTANDELRALKRLCLPQIASAVRGYFEESVVGYTAACRQIALHPPKTLEQLDAIAITGLTTQGDTTLQIQLIRPTNDLTDLLSLPETSPLPIESFVGVSVTNDPLSFIGDGPYRFVSPQSGETYALSRNPAWTPGGDPLRRAYVDHVSVRGGMTAAKVVALVQSGGADLSLDVSATAQQASDSASDAIITTPSQSSVVLAVGSRGPAAARLGVQGVRRVLAACIDAPTRAAVASALGAGLATPSSDLLANLSLTPDGKRTPTPSPSVSPSVTPSPSASVSPTASPSRSTSSGSTAPPLPPARCARTIGVTGATLTLLIPAGTQARAVARLVAARLALIGVRLRAVAPSASQYATLVRLGGWDLLLAVRPLRYPAPRSLLAPLVDGTWPGADAVAVRRSPLWLSQMLTAVAERQETPAKDAWDAVNSNLSAAAVVVPLAQLNTVYLRGTNVEQAPISPVFSNADPANVALGSTRPGDPARSPTATP